MKKIICLILAFCLTVFCFSFVNFKNTYALNDDGLIINNASTGVDTSTTQSTPITSGDKFYDILNNSSNSFYLNNDITISSFEQINFSGTLDGKGHTITLSQTVNEDDDGLFDKLVDGLFDKLVGATIKNLNIVWNTSSTLNTVGALANYSEGSTIENVVVSGSINVESKQSIYAGGLIGSALGTEIKNCYSNVSINVRGKGLTATEIAVGGLVGKMQNGIINNSFVYNSSNENLIEVTVTKDDDGTELQPIYNIYVGGLVGLILKGKIINNFTYLQMSASTTNSDIQPKIGLLIGKISSGVYLPDYNSIAYNYGFSNSGSLVGENTSYTLTNCSIMNDSSILKDEATFKNTTMWNLVYPWDFDTTWCVKADNHIVLQVFEDFSISVSAPDYVEFTITASATSSSTNTFDFGESVTISAKIEEGKSLYYKISNIKKDEINLKNESEDNDEYSTTIQISSITSGLYTINTSTINYGFTVESGDFSQGGVKIKGAQISRESIDEISLAIDGEYQFEAVPAQNYGFVQWVWVTINEDDGTEILTPAKLGKVPDANQTDNRQ